MTSLIYGTDNGPSCDGCRSTVYAYIATTDPWYPGRLTVRATCVSCGKAYRFFLWDTVDSLRADAIRMEHEHQIRGRP